MKKYQAEINAGELTIFGAVDDFTNCYKAGEGRLIIVNINNETDPEKICIHLSITTQQIGEPNATLSLSNIRWQLPRSLQVLRA